ncbi:AAA family ATPase [Flavobacterium sp. WC2509]|uniref:AAA family ATPase n=1 Tax=Flavobacterium sp. WC2509 TaxID=3461406 RepID=UPI004043A424
MRLAAIYIEEHEYLFDNKPQTINFGGKYIYKFSKRNSRNIIVSRKENEQYIESFYNIANSKSNLNSISAIVGENGAGKSSILDCIRSMFIEYPYALPGGIITAVVEIDDEIRILESNYTVYFDRNNEVDDADSVELQPIENNKIQTIYYSPHLDLKYNFNFSDLDKYDISIDTTIEKDLEDLDKKGTNENGFTYHPVEELVFKNTLRQIYFLSSPTFNDNKTFSEIFNIPKYNKGILFFRDYKIDPEYWNVPRNFKYFFLEIFKKIEEENELWTNVRIFDENHNLKNQAEVNCYLLERKIISSFLSVIIEQMNKQNTFLNEGIFKHDIEIEAPKDGTALDFFKFFLEFGHIKKGSEFKIFNHDKSFELIDYIFEIINNIKDESYISKSSFHINLNDLEKILILHKDVLIDLFNYYPKTDGIIQQSSNIDGFISFRPTDRKLSSGENALLNFYSKLYDFIQLNLTEKSKFKEDKLHYILLLDEADLGFHPTWKKKYIISLINTIPYFFENLSTIPSIQIIFTTHDPLTLSDLQNNSIIYLKRDGKFSKVLALSEPERPKKTFGANITNLLSDSFFISDGLIGDFAKLKIEETINWINTQKESRIKKVDLFKEQLAYHKKVIELIDEKVIKLKLSEMLSEIEGDTDFQKKIYDQEIEYLIKKRQTLN